MGYYLEDLFAGLGVSTHLISAAAGIFLMVCYWFIFVKAGEGGWKILIPIYGDYIKFKIAGCTGRFWVSLILSVATIVLGAFGLVGAASALAAGSVEMLTFSTILFALVVAVLGLIIAIIRVTVHFKTAKAFGQPGVFGLALWLLPVVFYAVLAFSKSMVYKGTNN